MRLSVAGPFCQAAFTCPLNFSFRHDTRSDNTCTISLLVLGDDLMTVLEGGCRFCSVSTESLSIMVPSMSSAALVTVCARKTFFLKGSAASFPAVTMGSVNAISYDLEFAPKSGVAQRGTDSGSLSATGRTDLVSLVVQRVSVWNSIWSCSANSHRWTELIVLGLF